MKKYNVKNYIRYKSDVKMSIQNVKVKRFIDYNSKELKIIFLPLVENIGRKFATSQEASGVMSIMDIIQEGSVQLCKAVDKIDRTKLIESEDIEKTLKSFLAKRIRGGIRREIDRNRGTMRIPEHKLTEIRNTKDEKMVRMFFNSIFLSYDAKQEDENLIYQTPDKADPYNETLLNTYLMSLLNKHLAWNEVFVLSKSFGLDGQKWSANEIAKALEIGGVSAYVRISELKKQAVDKLIKNVDSSQVLDYL